MTNGSAQFTSLTSEIDWYNTYPSLAMHIATIDVGYQAPMTMLSWGSKLHPVSQWFGWWFPRSSPVQYFDYRSSFAHVYLGLVHLYYGPSSDWKYVQLLFLGYYSNSHTAESADAGDALHDDDETNEAELSTHSPVVHRSPEGQQHHL